MTAGTTVEVPCGRLQGANEGPLLVFRNVPYAQARRFRPPEPAAPWAGARDATRRGPVCPQFVARLNLLGGFGAEMVQSEACQNLTITTPSVAGRRPVMVWIHGGANMFGGGELPTSDAHKLSAEGDVVVVAISYRLGVFGYLWQSDPARRNLGLFDQFAALDWIETNIDRFGGDPDNITVFGQSAGGHSILAMLRVRGAARPFRRMILESAPIGVWPAPADAAKVAEIVNEVLGPRPDEAEAATMVAAAAKVLGQRGGLPFAPVLDAPPPERANLEAMVGWNRDDGSAMIAAQGADPKPATWFDLPETNRFTQIVQADPGNAFAASTPATSKTYLYRLDWRPKDSSFGACHALEGPLLLGEQAAWQGAAMLGDEPWEAVERLGRRMRAAWIRFATTGDPNPEGETGWSPFSDGASGRAEVFDQ